MPETDRVALKVAEDVAKVTGIELKVYEISSVKGKIKARLKGVKKTPTIIIGKKRMEHVPNKQDLLLFVKESATW